MSSRTILSFGLGLVALGNAIAAAAVLADLAYWTAAIGMFVTDPARACSTARRRKPKSAPFRQSAPGWPPDWQVRRGSLASSPVSWGLGAVLAAVAEANLRRLGEPLMLDQTVDWHDLSLRIVGGDASWCFVCFNQIPIRIALQGTVHASVAAGFGAALSVAAIVAVLASLASWRLIRAAGTRSS